MTASPGWRFLLASVTRRAGTVLVELSVVEQRFVALLEVVRDGVPIVEVADRYLRLSAG